MLCTHCGSENAQTSSFCVKCGRQLEGQPTDDGGHASEMRSARGQLLGFDDALGTGTISGEDGARYTFSRNEWRSQEQPTPGMHVDFVPVDREARDVYILYSPRNSGQASGAVPSVYAKSKLASGLFAILLGWLGIHKFYLGYTWSGIILLIAGTLGWIVAFPAIAAAVVGIIEGILYLTKSDEEFDRTYVRGKREWF